MRGTKSVWKMAAVLVLLVLVLPACSIPNVKPPDPEPFERMGLTQAVETPDAASVISAVQEATTVFDDKFVPPIFRLNKVSNPSFFVSMFTWCEEMRNPITDSIKATHQLNVTLEKADEAIALASPKTERGKRIALAGDEFITQMQILTAFTLQSLHRADGYFVSCQEANMSELSPENKTLLEKMFRRIEDAKPRIKAAWEKFLTIAKN